MSRHYYDWDESQAYKDGRSDVERGRRDYGHDRYAYDGVDRAYWDGRKDEEREVHEREEREEEERREYEHQERLYQERRDREQEEYIEMIRAEEEGALEEFDPPFYATPSTEEDLFRQILEDERDEHNSIQEEI